MWILLFLIEFGEVRVLVIVCTRSVLLLGDNAKFTQFNYNCN